MKSNNVPTSTPDAEIALNRFGLGARRTELERVRKSPQAWLLDQLQPLIFSSDLSSSTDALILLKKQRQQKQQMKMAKAEAMSEKLASNKATLKQIRLVADGLALDTLQQAITTDRPFQARLLDFFSNHFSVTSAGPRMRGLAPTLEREAIAPKLVGRFEDMLLAVEQHPAMLIYLNNEQSIGPDSKIGAKRSKGLNENLGREILELHTLGVNGGYQQNDVTELAKAITGWGVKGFFNDDKPGFGYRDKAHQPGSREVLGKRYSQTGIAQGEAILTDLARHPATARNISFKLARHFIADKPDSGLVDAMAERWLASNGELKSVLKVMIEHPASWNSVAQKFKTPREFLISACRACGQPKRAKQLMQALAVLGQTPFSAGSPAGFKDTAEAWDGAEGLLARVEWSAQFSSRVKADARTLARDILGEQLNPSTQKMIMRAESRQQALALFLMSPEFQRR